MNIVEIKLVYLKRNQAIEWITFVMELDGGVFRSTSSMCTIKDIGSF